VLRASMQNAGRKTCAGRQEKYAPDRARWGLFSVSPPKRATHVKKKYHGRPPLKARTTQDHINAKLNIFCLFPIK